MVTEFFANRAQLRACRERKFIHCFRDAEMLQRVFQCTECVAGTRRRKY
jgi:hypothetical protein